MQSHQLLLIIENHWDQITTDVIDSIKSDPSLPVISRLPHAELEGWGRTQAKNLAHWLSGSPGAWPPAG